MAEVLHQGRSLAETPTYSVASVVAVMVFVCLLVERSIYRFGEVNTENSCVDRSCRVNKITLFTVCLHDSVTLLFSSHFQKLFLFLISCDRLEL